MRIKPIIVIGIIVFLNCVLQATLSPRLEILGCKPNTALLFIVAFAVLRGELTGAVVGFASGLLWDLTTGGLPGYYALLGAATGFLCGIPFSGFYKENYLFPALLSLVSCVCWEVIYFVTHLTGKAGFLLYAAKVGLPSIAYTMVLSLPAFLLVYWINKRLEEKPAK